MTQFENIPAAEAAQIADTVKLTLARLDTRYPGASPCRRGVHPKDHGAVTAKFKILDGLAPELRVGLFANPGQQFDALIRFSNADVNHDKPDSSVSGATIVHGSRGMAVKVLGVSGTALMPTKGPLTQDFLMINQPVFAFANVEDYEALSKVLLAMNDVADGFFQRLGDPDPNVRARANTTLGIVKRIQSNTTTMAPPASVPYYQPPPACPVDNRYFSAAAFLFGPDRAAKFSAKPVPYPSAPGTPNCSDPNYLRMGLKNRMAAGGDGGKDIVFEFQAQVRGADSLTGKIDSDVENVCTEWDETLYPFRTVATITIPPQDIDSPERQALCEDLVYSPWNGLAEHQPIGGINRLRKDVYIASSQLRHAQPTPTFIRCPVMKPAKDSDAG